MGIYFVFWFGNSVCFHLFLDMCFDVQMETMMLKITAIEKVYKSYFFEIVKGTYFIFDNGCYLKTDVFESGKHKVNCVQLNKENVGDLCFFENHTKVLAVSVKKE